MTEPANYVALGFWLQVGQAVGTAGVFLYVWWSNRSRVTQKKMETMKNDFDSKIATIKKDLTEHRKLKCEIHSTDLAALKTTLKLLPDQRDLRELSDGISSLTGRLKGIARAVDLLTQNELKGGD